MKRPSKRNLIFRILIPLAACALSFTGCATPVGSGAADLALAGAGGVAGYHLSDGDVGIAAAGAAVGYVGSRVAQAQVQSALRKAEQRGYDRAMNQAVKQQYWIIQNQQRSRESSPVPEPRLTPVVIPGSTVNGVQQNARVEYLRLQP